MSIQAAKGYLKRLRLSSGDLMFRVLLLATLLNVAFIFGSSYPPAVNASQQALQLTQDRTTHVRRGEADNDQQKEPIWRWLRHDAAGFFTLWLVVVGGGQLVLFWVQLVFIRKSLDDAKVAANAARDGARAAQDSADIAKLSMIAGDRAYVHFNGCRWISHRVDENSKVFWRLRPYGSTVGTLQHENCMFMFIMSLSIILSPLTINLLLPLTIADWQRSRLRA